jgi:hypothetical protein
MWRFTGCTQRRSCCLIIQPRFKLRTGELIPRALRSIRRHRCSLKGGHRTNALSEQPFRTPKLQGHRARPAPEPPVPRFQDAQGNIKLTLLGESSP